MSLNIANLNLVIEALKYPKSSVHDLILFDMGHFGTKACLMDYEREDGLARFTTDVNECGTVCCAAGLAGLTPAVQGAGLFYNMHDQIFYIDGRPQADGFWAMSNFLGITERISALIFNDWAQFYHANGFVPDAHAVLQPQHVVAALEALKDPNHEWVDASGRDIEPFYPHR